MENFEFELGFEEELIKETLNKAFTKLSPSDVVRKHIDDRKINEEVKSFLAVQGLLGMLERKRLNTDMNLTLTTILAKEAGKRLVNFPVIEHVLGVHLLKEIEQINEDEILPYELGDQLISIGWNSKLSFETVANETLLTGKVDTIPFASEVDTILVPIKRGIEGGNDDFVLSVNVKRFKRYLKPLKTHDLTYPIYELELKDLPIDGDSIKKYELNLIDFYNIAHLLMTAEMQGIAEKTMEITLDYMNERKQFGVSIGSFQAVKHMLADMHVLCESSKVTIDYASWTLENDGEDKDIISSIAKSYVSNATRKIIQESIQLHGGVAITWEHDLHMYLKRTYRLANMTSTAYEECEKVATYLLGSINK